MTRFMTLIYCHEICDSEIHFQYNVLSAVFVPFKKLTVIVLREIKRGNRTPPTRLEPAIFSSAPAAGSSPGGRQISHLATDFIFSYLLSGFQICKALGRLSIDSRLFARSNNFL